MPGSKIATDPQGDKKWNEPSDWDGRNVTGVWAAGAQILKDTTLEVVKADVGFGDRTTLYGAGSHRAPIGTEAGKHLMAIRTRYENGNIVSTRIVSKPESCMKASKNNKRCTGGS